jgi:hypothetical protein
MTQQSEVAMRRINEARQALLAVWRAHVGHLPDGAAVMEAGATFRAMLQTAALDGLAGGREREAS